ncbi:MAG: Beta-lactamase class C-like and penicillin binding proteins (PBPs) superfamily [Rhodanobacteraceae bacterium]|jgi:CubicO group peptidase (beta-lactamase class C family)|nr:MAG: Beta-lactamase class C-like and penicillin binding proteins (PBPs) superfamily [Rhodanobacteraceae bacterium]
MKRIVQAAFVLACAFGSAIAQMPQPTPHSRAAENPPPAVLSHAMTGEDLSTFFGGMLPYMLARGDIAGGTVVVVKDGKVMFAHGYGYADLETRAPVFPVTTLFRIGSVSKLFTWTAVMQLVEQHKLDLDRDINAYLDFRIPPRFGKPITLRDLMTHTPGFEDTARDLLPATPASTNLEHYLKAHLPARIFPPGTIVAYSNYGAGLAGYIVQRVSGESFDAYIQRHILEPLDMHHSTFAQPLPANLAPLLAKGYVSASDGDAKPFELANPAPAGAMTSSALDMANFMIAQLQDGRFGSTRILSQQTAQLMHSPQHTSAPGLNGFDLGFYQENCNGQRIIGHGGDTIVFHSDLHLLLDANVGVFMSFNSAGKNGAVNDVRSAIFRAFLDRYFPWQVASEPTWKDAKVDAARVAGSYESSRRIQSALRFLYLLGQANVQAQPDGTITVSAINDAAGNPVHWREIGPLRYREVNGQALLDFVADRQGHIMYLATSENPASILQRMPARLSPTTFGPLLGITLVILLATLLAWFGGWRIRRHYGGTLALSRARRITRMLSRLGVLTCVAVAFGWCAFVAAISANELLLVRGGLTPWMYLLYALGVFALLGVFTVVANTAIAWFAPRRSRWVRTGECLLALAAIYLAWFIVAFGLVSFDVRF